MREETILQNSIAELQAKLEHLHAKYIGSQEEINLLSHQLLQLIESNHILPDLQLLINNGTSNITSIKLPSIYNFLPHFLNDPNSLRPAFVQSKGRSGVSMVLGVPTVKREVQSYLMATLKNLLDRMSVVEIADTLIIVLVAEVSRIIDYQKIMVLFMCYLCLCFEINGSTNICIYSFSDRYGLRDICREANRSSVS
jgi:alpha-1,3-mannosylglycoprotein beta-1,4-N-acetylglucosaminyltransferase A/B